MPAPPASGQVPGPPAEPGQHPGGRRPDAVLGLAVVIPAHYDGWAHFSEGRADLARAFDDAGLTAQLRLSDHGAWIPLGA